MAKFNIPTTKELEHARAMQQISAGWLGKCFGTGNQATQSMSFIIMALLLIVGTILCLCKEWNQALDFWKIIILPITTLIIGYFFGRTSSET